MKRRKVIGRRGEGKERAHINPLHLYCSAPEKEKRVRKKERQKREKERNPAMSIPIAIPYWSEKRKE